MKPYMVTANKTENNLYLLVGHMSYIPYIDYEDYKEDGEVKKKKKVKIIIDVEEDVRTKFKLMTVQLLASYPKIIKAIVELWEESLAFRQMLKKKLGLGKYHF